MIERPRIDPLAGNHNSSTTAGILAARAWLAARALDPPPGSRWYASVGLELEAHADTAFRIDIYSEEWGFFFSLGSRASWIRVTDVPFVHGRDDFRLLSQTPALKDIGTLMRRLEREHRIAFRRDLAAVRTDVPKAEPEVRRWALTL